MKYFIIWWQCKSDTRSMFERVKFTCLEACTDYIWKVLHTPCALDCGRVVAMNNEPFTDKEYEHVCANAIDIGWRGHHSITNWR